MPNPGATQDRIRILNGVSQPVAQWQLPRHAQIEGALSAHMHFFGQLPCQQQYMFVSGHC
jgi:hypothetical protein